MHQWPNTAVQYHTEQFPNAKKIPRASPIYLFPLPKPLTTPDLFLISTILPFPDCQRVDSHSGKFHQTGHFHLAMCM